MRRLTCSVIGHRAPSMYLAHSAECARCGRWFEPWPHRGVWRRGGAMYDIAGRTSLVLLGLAFGYLVWAVMR